MKTRYNVFNWFLFVALAFLVIGVIIFYITLKSASFTNMLFVFLFGVPSHLCLMTLISIIEYYYSKHKKLKEQT
ncbi:MAG: hypothetical protein A3F72_09865 [Bacteroidetes bacterium RIFCSPLOWO2_12_FULL_35_15]|nr:MAG: hypothetical protein A3F72_09865 [Bacteroidetes bacterium RIFCSPLOWO2_12_FULL_35_15]